MTNIIKAHWKKALFIPAVAVGVAALVLAVKGREGPEQEPLRETTSKVRIIEAASVTVLPRALGYGTVTPAKTWEAVAEVKGRIVEIHPRLKKGALLARGDTLLRIDATDYQLAIAETEANIRAVNAQLAELKAKESNTRLSLGIEERTLKLSIKDLERKRELQKRKNASQAAVDQEERNVLARRQAAQNLRNTLNLIPAERQVLEATLALSRTRLETAMLNLDRTVIQAPFDCRIAQVNVEQTQYAAQGKVLVIADGIDAAEVSAQIPMERLIHLILPGIENPFLTSAAPVDLRKVLALKATVRLRGGDIHAEWPARFARISDTIDPQTRTAGIIVAVDEPYRMIIPGKRPPLTKNMFVEVELSGPVRTEQVIVPRVALHDGQLYVADKDNRLELRDVTVAFSQTNFAAISQGLKAGERVIVSDLIPAVDGMLLDPVADERTKKALIAEATGKGAVR
jgi:membrane fusion protein, multidrug efflux system